MALHPSLLLVVLFAFVSVCSSERPFPPFHHNGKPLPGAHPPTLRPLFQPHPQPHGPSPFIHKPPFEKNPTMKDAYQPTFPYPHSPQASPLFPKPPPFNKFPPFSPANAPLYHNPGSPVFNGPAQPHPLPHMKKSPPKPVINPPPKHGHHNPPPMHMAPPPHTIY